jgi:hypothetical protein
MTYSASILPCSAQQAPKNPCAVSVLLSAILTDYPIAHIILVDPHNEYGRAFGKTAEVNNVDSLLQDSDCLFFGDHWFVDWLWIFEILSDLSRRIELPLRHLINREAVRSRCTNGTVRLAASARPWQVAGHDDITEPVSRFPLPARGLEHAVWLYHCFSLSLRDVELILKARGIVVSYESIREWGVRFGRIFANALAPKAVLSRRLFGWDWQPDGNRRAIERSAPIGRCQRKHRSVASNGTPAWLASWTVISIAFARPAEPRQRSVAPAIKVRVNIISYSVGNVNLPNLRLQISCHT